MQADVVVIGAGAAGLAAARHLAGESLRVIVLEARDRVGGRAWSRPFGRNVVPAELGAEFIHGRAETTMGILREAGLAAIDTGGESWNCGDGSLHRDGEDFMDAARVFERTRELTEDESVNRFLQRVAGTPAMRKTAERARLFVEGFDAADPAVASVRSIFQEWSAGIDSAHWRPLGGYQPMMEFLRNVSAAGGARVHTSTIVRRVAWEPGAVVVQAQAVDGTQQTFRARCAIVTLPVGVLRLDEADGTGVTFEPSLPAAKQSALRSIEMGHVVRVNLRFRTAFWEDLDGGRYRDMAFIRCVGRPFTAFWTQVPVRSEQIVAWAGGPRAIALNEASQDEVIALALDELGSMFGEPALVRAQFEDGAMHDWASDPFARGAYSYILVGGIGARAALAAPIDGTLFFAGEATSTDGEGGTVNGALETGERAAREVAAAIGTTRDV